MVYKCFHKKSMGNGAATLANKSASKNEKLNKMNN